MKLSKKKIYIIGHQASRAVNVHTDYLRKYKTLFVLLQTQVFTTLANKFNQVNVCVCKCV